LSVKPRPLLSHRVLSSHGRAHRAPLWTNGQLSQGAKTGWARDPRPDVVGSRCGVLCPEAPCRSLSTGAGRPFLLALLGHSRPGQVAGQSLLPPSRRSIQFAKRTLYPKPCLAMLRRQRQLMDEQGLLGERTVDEQRHQHPHALAIVPPPASVRSKTVIWTGWSWKA
jgi:hypothetical protein